MIQDWLKRLRVYWNASRRNQVIVTVSGIVVVALLVGSIALLNNRGGATAHEVAQATATTAQQTITSTGTVQPTPIATAAGTAIPGKPVNQPVVGGTEAGFTATFGRPVGTGVDSGNNLPTVSYKGTGPIGDILIELNNSKSYVVGVVISAQQNSPWDAATIQIVCPHFAPTDASYDPTQTITNGSNQEVGLFQLGHSKLLASSLPGSVFVDSQGQPVANGTFSTQIYYIEGSNGKLAYACTQRLGNQPASPGA